MEQHLIDTPDGCVDVVVAGEGPPILYFHGTLAGAEFALEMDRSLINSDFQVIIPNRPGYCGTPLNGRTTTAHCADMAARVLDYLHIDRVAVIGTSAGGPPALAFAIRHPARAAALVLQCAQVHQWDHPRWGPPPRRWIYHLVRTAPTRWILWKLHPMLFRIRLASDRRFLRDLTGDRYAELENDRAALELAATCVRHVSGYGAKSPGYHNDLATWARENVLSRGQVTCPTLLLYDRHDPYAPFCHAEYALDRIPGAQLVELHAGGHLIWFGPDADLMQERRTGFLKQHPASPADVAAS